MNKKTIKRKYKRKFDNDKYCELLCDLTSEYCPKNSPCILKKFLLSLHPSPRLLIQLKCIEKYKWDSNQSKTEELSWDEVIDMWVNNGYAEAFAELYEEDISYRTLYKKIKEYIFEKNNK